MSRRIIPFFIFCCFVSSIFLSCTKKENPMPVKIISEGKTVKDGYISVESEDGSVSEEFLGKAVFENGGITITNTTTKNSISVRLRVNGQSKGAYSTGSSYGSSAEYSSGSYKYTTGGSYETGRITITEIDQVKKTISGIYDFKGYSSNYGIYKQVSGSFSKIPFAVVNFTNSLTANVVEGSGYSGSWIGQNVSASYEGSRIVISAEESDNSQIELLISPNVVSGASYTLGSSGSYNNTAYYTNKNGYSYNAYSSYGSLNITSHDKLARKISGSFYFQTAYASYYSGYYGISGGSFSVMY